MNPLESAQAERERIVQQIDQLQRKVQQTINELQRKLQAVDQSIKILQPVYAPVKTDLQSLQYLLAGNTHSMPFTGIGITPATEEILIGHPNQLMTPTEVRDLIIQAGLGSSLPKENPMAAVHQILKRLVDRKGQYVAVEDQGKTLYKYDPSLPPAIRRRRYYGQEENK